MYSVQVYFRSCAHETEYQALKIISNFCGCVILRETCVDGLKLEGKVYYNTDCQ